MERLTQRSPGCGYVAGGHTTEELLARLGRLEDLYEALIEGRAEQAGEMEKLRRQGRTKSATYRQRLANKLMLQNLIDRFDIYAG